MKFLDRKEQVLELQLTHYGKGLLSRGRFKPTHYAFFDDDVIYDSKYMSTGADPDKNPQSLEKINNASDRIRKAIRPETQFLYSGAETNISQITDGVEYEFYEETAADGTKFFDVLQGTPQTEQEVIADLSLLPPTIADLHCMGLPMGTSRHNTSKAPAFAANFLSGDIKGPIEFFTGSSGLLKIPQIEVRGTFNVYVGQGKDNKAKEEGKQNVDFYDFSGDTYFKVVKEDIILDLSEINSLFENENYEIEVYEISEGVDYIGSDLGLKEYLKPLHFIKKQEVEDNLYDSSMQNVNNEQISPNNVEYYFDISVDNEIQDTISITDSTNIYDIPPNNEEPC